MKIINREVGYAIKSLCFMFLEQERIVTTSHLASYFQISRPFLRKILQKLNQAGILESYKGKKGGFKPSVSANELLLLDLIEIFQGKFQLNSCSTKGQECPLINDCPIKREIETIEKRIINDLSGISLKMIIDKNSILKKEKHNEEETL